MCEFLTGTDREGRRRLDESSQEDQKKACLIRILDITDIQQKVILLEKQNDIYLVIYLI